MCVTIAALTLMIGQEGRAAEEEPHAWCREGTGECCTPPPGAACAWPGIDQGPNTQCLGDEACCLPDGTCVDADAICCDDLGGVAKGYGTTCADPGLYCVTYVKQNTAGGDDGQSWATAYDELCDAIAGASAGDIIWVAAGTYTPDACGAAGDRTATFNISSPPVWIYGGFTGTENPGFDLSTRDFDANETTLSGDLGGGTNSYHVVTYSTADASAVIDGFTIEDGAADGAGPPNNQGAAIYIRDEGGVEKCLSGGPTIRNCVIRNNVVAHHGAVNDHASDTVIDSCTFENNVSTASNAEGAALQIHSGNTKVSNSVFTNNVSGAQGGAIWSGCDDTCGSYDCTNTQPTPTITNCSFVSNEADGIASFTVTNGQGGAVWANASSVTFDSCHFEANDALNEGGALWINNAISTIIKEGTFVDNTTNGDHDAPRYATGGAAVWVENTTASSSAIDVSDSRFLRNRTLGALQYGGAIYTTSTTLTVNNSIFFHNGGGYAGGGIFATSNAPNLTNCTLSGNTVSIADTGGGIFAASSLTVTNSVLYNNADGNGTTETAQIFTSGGAPTVTYSNWQGHTGGTGNISAYPHFVVGPFGNHYLSQTAAGQSVNSPCVDAGSTTAAGAGMDARTTRTDHVADSGIVDMGYHFPLTSEPVVQAEGGRYLRVVPPQLAGNPNIALVVKSDDYPCLQVYVDAAGETTATPVYRTPSQWWTVHVYGDKIVPDTQYSVYYTTNGVDLVLIGSDTTWTWGDVNHDGLADSADTSCTVSAFQGVFGAPPCQETTAYAADVAGCVPDGLVNFTDIGWVDSAAQGNPYPCAAPCSP